MRYSKRYRDLPIARYSSDFGNMIRLQIAVLIDFVCTLWYNIIKLL